MRKRLHNKLKKRIAKARILVASPDLGGAAFITGNAAGLHGGRHLKYGKRERQANRKDESAADNLSD
jgi:hypothetical protein